MKRAKNVLTACLVLMIVALSQGCIRPRNVENCTPQDYYEILGAKIATVQRFQPSTNSSVLALPSDIHEEAFVIEAGEQAELLLQFETSFFATAQGKPNSSKKQPFSFSFFPQAYADKISSLTPCMGLDGQEGTPDKITSVDILSDADFNPEHPANTSLNDCFQIASDISFTDWLENVVYAQNYKVPFVGSIYSQVHILRISSQPYRQRIHQLRLQIQLEDGRKEEVLLPKLFFN